MEKKMIISSGVNGETTFSLITEVERRIIYSKMKLPDLAKRISERYPELAKKIFQYSKNGFSSDFPEELDISRLDPSKKAEFFKEIANSL